MWLVGVGGNLWVWLVGVGGIYGCGCKEVYRFPHTVAMCVCVRACERKKKEKKKKKRNLILKPFHVFLRKFPAIS